MGSVRLLSLFRCNAMEEDNESFDKGDQIKYFVTDYFDGIQVEKFTAEDHKTLAECMGIERNANKSKKGVSHHRYWLYTDEDAEKDIFEEYRELPLLTVIQVSISPDIYQGKTFETGEKISESTIFKKLKIFLQEKSFQDIEWEAFQLLTSGSFAVIVRSKTVLSAYNVAAAIRRIRIEYTYNDMKNIRVAFHTYSIFGVSDDNIMELLDMERKAVSQPINWDQCLNDSDQIVLRLRFAQKYHISDKKTADLECFGRFLSGRYDYEISLEKSEFQLLYPFIKAYKFNNRNISAVQKIENPQGKVKLLISLMEDHYLSYINERVQVGLSGNPGDENVVWHVRLPKKFVSLFEKNSKHIDLLYKKANELEEEVSYLYKYSRNLQEYMRIMVRFTRILHEVNYRRELRISVSNLLMQYDAMLKGLADSLEGVNESKKDLKDIREEQRSKDDLSYKREEEDSILQDIKENAAMIEMHIGQGMYSLEMFLRYLRNINFQTLQTPNFDLQTNICIEKLLVTYSHFMKRFLRKSDNPYISKKQLYPILVPNLLNPDFSVAVLFDDDTDKETPSDMGKMAVVESPTFAYLCESCSLIPAIFHEIAHQFRYEERSLRNEVLWDTITKMLILDVVQTVLDEERVYDLREIQEKLVEPIWNVVKKKLFVVSKERVFDFQETFMVNTGMFYLTAADRRLSLVDACKEYIKKTRSCIRNHSDKKLVQYLSQIAVLIREYDLFKAFFAHVSVEEIPVSEDTKQNIYKNKYKKQPEAIPIIEKYFDADSQMLDYTAILAPFEGVRIYQEAQLIRAMAGVVEHVRKADSESYSAIVPDMASEFESIIKKYGLNLEKDETELKIDAEDGEESIISEIRDWWKKFSGIFEAYPAEKNEMVQLLKHLQEIRYYYKQVLEQSAMKNSYQELIYKSVFKDLCKVLRERLIKCLKELGNTPDRLIKWDLPLIPTEDIEYLRKQYSLMTDAQMEKLVVEKLNRIISQDETADCIENRIRYYREITSDLFMCAIMQLDGWGYLSLASAIFKFFTENQESQFFRVHAVIQSMYADVIEHQGVDAYLEEVKKLGEENLKKLCEQIGCYYQQNFVDKGIDIPEEYKKWFTVCITDKVPKTLEEYRDYFRLFPEDIDGEVGKYTSSPNPDESEKDLQPILSSSQRWVIRISKQNLEILTQLLNDTILIEDYTQKELWKDLIGSEAYFSKREQIHALLGENEIGTKEIMTLCTDIASILNKPADYFINKKSLLLEEIQFLLREYEESCREVFDYETVFTDRG